MKQENVAFYSSGLCLQGYFFPADAAPGPAPAVVLCTGFVGRKEGREHLVEPLVQAGYHVLVADHRGWGESEGDAGELYPLAQVEDIRSALSYLETRPEVRSDQLGLFGVSFGGANATFVAAVDDRVLASVSVSGIGDGREWLRGMRAEWDWQTFVAAVEEDRRERARTGKGRRVDPTEEIMVSSPERQAMKGRGAGDIDTPLACAQAIMDYRPAEVSHQIAPRAGLWICVEDDPVVPSWHSWQMYEQAQTPKKIVQLPGSTHYQAYTEHHDDIFEHSLDWFDRHLKGSARHRNTIVEG